MKSNRHEYRGIHKAHGEGWDKLVDPLIDLVLDAGGTVDQVKEKFGGLRFYFGGLNAIDWERIEPIVNKAESESYHICEQCGEPGKLYGNIPWWQTLCDKHLDEYKMWLQAQNEDRDEEEV